MFKKKYYKERLTELALYTDYYVVIVSRGFINIKYDF